MKEEGKLAWEGISESAEAWTDRVPPPPRHQERIKREKSDSTEGD